MAEVRHLGFVFSPFWTTNDVPIFPANGVMIQSDATEVFDFTTSQIWLEMSILGILSTKIVTSLI